MYRAKCSQQKNYCSRFTNVLKNHPIQKINKVPIYDFLLDSVEDWDIEQLSRIMCPDYGEDWDIEQLSRIMCPYLGEDWDIRQLSRIMCPDSGKDWDFE